MIGVVCICLGSFTVLSIAYIVFTIYLRPKFAARVRCWFCGERTTVPYTTRESFECPACDQYNGFNEDGDYCKPIPAQYDELSNGLPSCRRDEFLGGNEVLCDRCSQNQLLKVKQLANFVPYDEKNFEWEATAFERHLERVYAICADCQMKVQHELEIQNEAISMRLHHSDSWRSDRSFHEAQGEDRDEFNESIRTSVWCNSVIISVVLHTASLCCAVGLLVCKLDSGQWVWLQQWSVVYHPVLVWLDRHTELLAWAGLATGMAAKLCLGKYRLSLLDVVSGPAWLVVLLIQTGFIAYTTVSPRYDVVCCGVNTVACLLCLGAKRNRLNMANISLIRSSGSVTVQDQQRASPPLTGGLHEDEDSDIDDADVQVAPTVGSSDVGRLTDRLSGLDSWVHRDTGLRRSDSGLFSTGSQDFNSPGSSSQSQTRSDMSATGSPRPLISPASFKYTSTPAKHRFGLGPQNFGLFSIHQEPLQPFTGSRNLFTSWRHKTQPVMLTTQTIQSFGTVPFPKNLHSNLESDRLIRPPLRSSSFDTDSACTEQICTESEVTGSVECDEDLRSDGGDTLDSLVDRLLELPSLTCKPTELRRTDSGFFSHVSDCDLPCVSSTGAADQTGTPASQGPRQLIRSATFEYQSALSSQGIPICCGTKQPCPGDADLGWKTVRPSKMLLPTPEHVTGFGAAPYTCLLTRGLRNEA